MSILEALKEVEKVEELIVAIGTQLVSEVYNRDYTDMYCEEFFVDENSPELVICLLRFDGNWASYDNLDLSISGTLLDNPTKKGITDFIEQYKKDEEEKKKKQKEVEDFENRKRKTQKQLNRYEQYKKLQKEFGDNDLVDKKLGDI